MARDLGPQGITINNIQPGATDTDMNPADSPAALEYARSIALGRYGTPEEVASMVAFIASEEASYITGATINVDGELQSRIHNLLR
ncbi:NAD(P)-dependent dehydrogenase (short-subunit alcohol dehydrogenase family) [Paenibacillus sp. RC73]